MSDDHSIDNLPEQLNDIVADIEHKQQSNDKQAAQQRALEARRRIEALQEQRQLERDLADFVYD